MFNKNLEILLKKFKSCAQPFALPLLYNGLEYLYNPCRLGFFGDHFDSAVIHYFQKLIGFFPFMLCF